MGIFWNLKPPDLFVKISTSVINTSMKQPKQLAYLLAFLLLPLAVLGASDKWVTDYDAAIEAAKASDKHVLVDFTGSDWCGWCIRLKDEVFSKDEFKAYADENFVLLMVDFPRRKKLPADQTRRNRELAGKFDVKGFPTIVILDAEGKEVGRTGYRPGGAEAYVEHLAEIVK